MIKKLLKKSEWDRYYRQARHNYESAKRDYESGDYAWACFKAQQAGEILLKGFIRALGKFCTGHSIYNLLLSLEELYKVPEDIKTYSKILDKAYIPTRYPDAHMFGAPFELYSKEEVRQFFDCVERLFQFIEELYGDIQKSQGL